MSYEGLKLGIFGAFPETQRNKVWVATGQLCFPFPIPVLPSFWVIFGFAGTALNLKGSDQTSKMVDFDPVHPKVYIPIFSGNV